VELDKVMIAMLACAEECGGESGKRYVASAILTCSKEEDVFGALAALGTTWLTHLLFIFKTRRGHGNQPNKQPSGFATPTVEKMATHLLEGVGNWIPRTLGQSVNLTTTITRNLLSPL